MIILITICVILVTMLDLSRYKIPQISFITTVKIGFDLPCMIINFTVTSKV